jgi:hypothetical protein
MTDLPPIAKIVGPARVEIEPSRDGADRYWQIVVIEEPRKYLLYLIWTNPNHAVQDVVVEDRLRLATPNPVPPAEIHRAAVPPGCGGNASQYLVYHSPAIANGWFRTIHCPNEQLAKTYAERLAKMVRIV